MTRVRPGAWLGPRGIALAIALSLAAGLLARTFPWLPVVLALSFAFVAACAADWRTSGNALRFRRIAPDRYSLARRDAFRYEVENCGPSTLRASIFEGPVAKFAIDAEGARVTLPPKSRGTAEITFVPRERGRTVLGDSYAWYESALGLIRHRVRVEGGQPVRVLPDLRSLAGSEDLALRARLIDAGLRKLRRRGIGTEFESLREYATGDAFRDIDWKASARRGRMMIAQHEVERSQQVIVAIDAGRLMAARLGDRRKLDYAVSAALAVAALARRAADRVGVHAFAGRTLASVAPASGNVQAAAIVEALTDLEPQPEEPDYQSAALALRRAYRKRSLIVVFTDLFDPVASAVVLSSLALLVRSHLVLVALMNDAAIAGALDAEPRVPADAYRAAVAVSLAAERARAIGALRATGMLVVDVPARDLRLALLDAYLDVKTRGLL